MKGKDGAYIKELGNLQTFLCARDTLKQLLFDCAAGYSDERCGKEGNRKES